MHTSFLQTLLLSANSFKLWETSSEPEDLSSAWVSFLIKSSWGSGAATSHGSLRFVPVDIFVMLPLSSVMNYRNATRTGTSYLGVITPLWIPRQALSLARGFTVCGKHLPGGAQLGGRILFPFTALEHANYAGRKKGGEWQHSLGRDRLGK